MWHRTQVSVAQGTAASAQNIHIPDSSSHRSVGVALFLRRKSDFALWALTYRFTTVSDWPSCGAAAMPPHNRVGT
eukprot:scaffold19359_cov62-Phaeocystis_antarctica.AAC.1